MRLITRLLTLVLLAALGSAVVPVTVRAQALPSKLKTQLDRWNRSARRSSPRPMAGRSRRPNRPRAPAGEAAGSDRKRRSVSSDTRRGGLGVPGVLAVGS